MDVMSAKLAAEIPADPSAGSLNVRYISSQLVVLETLMQIRPYLLHSITLLLMLLSWKQDVGLQLYLLHAHALGRQPVSVLLHCSWLAWQWSIL